MENLELLLKEKLELDSKSRAFLEIINYLKHEGYELSLSDKGDFINISNDNKRGYLYISRTTKRISIRETFYNLDDPSSILFGYEECHEIEILDNANYIYVVVNFIDNKTVRYVSTMNVMPDYVAGTFFYKSEDRTSHSEFDSDIILSEENILTCTTLVCAMDELKKQTARHGKRPIIKEKANVKKKNKAKK